MTGFSGSGWWNAAAWASYVDLPDPATAVEAEPARVGYVTIEFDVRGEAMGDGQLYPDDGVAGEIAARRNAAEGNPEDLTDRWFVATVVAELPEAAAAVRHAAVRRRSDIADQLSTARRAR